MAGRLCIFMRAALSSTLSWAVHSSFFFLFLFLNQAQGALQDSFAHETKQLQMLADMTMANMQKWLHSCKQIAGPFVVWCILRLVVGGVREAGLF